MPALQQLARDHHVELGLLGVTGGDAVVFGGQVNVSLSDLRTAWETALLPLPSRRRVAVEGS